MADDPQAVHNFSAAGDNPVPDQAPGVKPSAKPSAKSGIELARDALAQAKADALKRGSVPGQGKRKGPRPKPVRDPSRGGDPRAFGSAIKDLLADRGWQQEAAVGRVFGNWPSMVGPELAEHTKPDRFEDGELTILVDSSAWATQVRLLAPQLVHRLNLELGHGTVQRVKVVGPSTGQRRKGAWRVR